ncbi:MAG: 2-phospho-L-lactate transferase [Methanomicrobiales archaeon]|jgi:LPPG:FO 2-phospho-L-lactate transferase|nr:2-phospho-L-lactate transferase [Methanomicrobiales archaeon]
MITFLSGGTGTPKLLRGARLLFPDSDITVIVNTGEDMWYQQGYLCPDIDTVTYLFSELLNTESWWGITDDSFHTHEFLQTLGAPECYLSLGDRDRAVNLLRAGLLHAGLTLTKATREINDRLGIGATILPMSNTPCTTYVKHDGKMIHFQEYWIKYRANITIDDVQYISDTPLTATKEVLDAISNAELIVIGPSNPITSIGPILHCDGVQEALMNANGYVVSISPFIGDAPISGPARELMIARGHQPNSRGVYEMYEPFLNCFVQDIRDPIPVQNAVRADTLMKDAKTAAELMRFIQNLKNKSPLS